MALWRCPVPSLAQACPWPSRLVATPSADCLSKTACRLLLPDSCAKAAECLAAIALGGHFHNLKQRRARPSWHCPIKDHFRHQAEQERDHDVQTPSQTTKFCCCFRLQTRMLGIHLGDFRLQAHKRYIHRGEILIYRSETLIYRREPFVNHMAQRVEPLAHHLAKFAKTFVHRSAQNVPALVHRAVKGVEALVHRSAHPVERLVQHVEPLAQRLEPLVHRLAQPVERLVQHLEPLAQRVEPLVHRVAQRVKSAIDVAKPCILYHHSLGGSLSGRFIRTDLAAEGTIYSSESIAVNAIITSSCAVG